MHPLTKTQRSYDIVAEHYARSYFDELAHKPFDCGLLDWLIARSAGRGPIGDIGCGPGQIAAYLHAHGAEALGIDLSAEMVRIARTLTSGVRFEQGDMRALPLPDASLGGLAAFYSIIHVPRDELAYVFAEFRRVLRPAGTALITCHIGDDDVHVDDFLEPGATFDGYLHQRPALRAQIEAAGFTIDEAIERDPYPDVEFASRRLYVFARAAPPSPASSS
jgi:SAM-dependent methyltransferase